MRFGPLSWLHAPFETGPPEAGTLDEIEEVAILQQLFELADAVAAELFVFEINGIPGTFLPIQNIDGTGFRVPWYQ